MGPSFIKVAFGASVIEILRQHHGGARVRHRSAAAAGDEVEVRYDGPKPTSKEAALVMLADSVDAATRHLDQTLVDAGTNVEQVITEAMQALLLDGQLDASVLSLRDFDRTRRAFVGVVEARVARRGRPSSLTPLTTEGGPSLVRIQGGGAG